MTGDNDRVLRDILVHVGETRKGMKTLEDDVGGIRRQIHDLGKSSMPKDECTARHVIVAKSIDGVKTELRDDLQQIKADVRAIKVRTGAEHRIVSRNGALPTSGGPPPAPEDKQPRGLKYWLGVMTAAISIISFLGAILWGVFQVGQYMERVDQSINKSAKRQQQLQATVKQVVTQEPRVVYIKVPVHPDAGPSRSNRRRRRARTRSRAAGRSRAPASSSP